MVTVEVIPYSNFKQRIRLVKELAKTNARIEVYERYIYVERGDSNDRGI